MRRLALISLLGFGAGFFAASCGRTPLPCGPGNCDGCCDTSGECQVGDATIECGKQGALCESCAAGFTCRANACESTTGLGGGGGSVGGGTGGGNVGGGTGGGGGGIGGGLGGGGGAMGGGPGGGAGGGAAGGAGGGGGTPGCGAATCPNGCCSTFGTCITSTPFSCGIAGSMCTVCSRGQTCNQGTCQACTGCIDGNGVCQPGTANSACGKNGGFCRQCQANRGETCTLGQCTAPATCNAQNCFNGCCAGTTCIRRSQMTDRQCGTGTSGSMCVDCTTFNATCNRMTASCSTTFVDAGLPPFDGGLPPLDAGAVCTAGSCAGGCCDNGALCTQPGQTCLLESLLTGVQRFCDGNTLTCL